MALPSSGKQPTNQKKHEITPDMTKRNEKRMIVGLDIGTTKVVTLVAEINPAGKIEVIGMGEHPSHGMKKGVVVNIESMVQSIRRSIEEAELMAGCEIHAVNVGIAGNHIESINSHGMVAIKDKEVTEEDVERVIDAARAVAIPADRRIIHILPQQFLIDDQEGIREPVGMSGVRLEAKVHMVTGANSAAQNIIKCIARCELEVQDMTLEQLASSYAVLTEDEKELGVCIVDIGGGTTDVAVLIDGAIHHTKVFPVAGDQVTNDIAVALRTPTKYAEEIKRKYACALRQLTNPEETIEVPGIGDRPSKRLARQVLAEVVEPRYEELFSLIKADLKHSGYEELCTAGVVLTGGSSKMEGVIDLAEEVFHMPVRLGVPHEMVGLSDMIQDSKYATAVGLLIAARSSQGELEYDIKDNGVSGFIAKLKKWFQGNF